MFTGLSAFPLTPLVEDRLDEPAFARIVKRLASAGVDSITALGSTGSYAYLNRAERERVTHLALEHANGTPVFVGIGALRTSEVLANAATAEQAGASGLLLAPMSYQPLTEDDVFGLFQAVSEHSGVPVILYDNPGTTHVRFSLDLYARIAQLPGLASIKIPGAPGDLPAVRDRVAAIREVVPAHVTVGISGDAHAATGLSAGCDAWYSVIGGTLPEPALRITRAALSTASVRSTVGRGLPGEEDPLAVAPADPAHAAAESARLDPLWALFAEFGGSLRVVAAIAEQLGFAQRSCLPLPIRGLNDVQRARVAAVVQELGLGGAGQ